MMYLPIALLQILLATTNLQVAELSDPATPAKFKYESEKFKVSISFPVAYTESEEPTEHGVTLKVLATKDDNSFFLGVTLHETEMTGHKDLAAVSLESFTNTLQGTEVMRQTYKKGSHEGLDATIQIPDKGAWVFYRVILVGQFQYQVVSIQNSEVQTKDTKKFMKSFKFIQ